MKPIILLLLAAILLNGCENGLNGLFKPRANDCLLVKKKQVNNTGYREEEHVYTYNTKRQLRSEKFTTNFGSILVTTTFFYEYDSDGQLIKKTNDGIASVVTYKYENKRLIEEKYGDDKDFVLIQYSYNSNGQKTKEIHKSTRVTASEQHFETTYEYQDTLLVNLKTAYILVADKSFDTESTFKYNQAHQLEEMKYLNGNQVLIYTEKYEYDKNGNQIKKNKVDAYGRLTENAYTYNGNKLVEATQYYTDLDRPRRLMYKITNEYKQGNLVKESYSYGGDSYLITEFAYDCNSK